jgi:hypothetical protein
MYGNDRKISQEVPPRLLKIGLFFILMAVVIANAGASTPPVRPVLSFNIVPESGTTDTVFTFSAVWEATVPFNLLPEDIQIAYYIVPAGSEHGGGIYLSPVVGSCTKATCTYAATVPGNQLFNGTFKVIATDPVSGVTDSKILSITPGSGNPGYGIPAAPPSVFLPISGIVGLVLLCILVLLIRKKTP